MDIFKYRGSEIRIGSNGMFFAMVDDATIEAPTLIGAKQQIDTVIESRGKAALSLPVACVIRDKEGDERVFITNIIGINRTNREFQFEPKLPKYCNADEVLAATEENQELLAKFVADQKAFRAIESTVQDRLVKLHNGYGRIDLAQYESVLAEARASHQKSIASSAVA